jgi:hypothetical protein
MFKGLFDSKMPTLNPMASLNPFNSPGKSAIEWADKLRQTVNIGDKLQNITGMINNNNNQAAASAGANSSNPTGSNHHTNSMSDESISSITNSEQTHPTTNSSNMNPLNRVNDLKNALNNKLSANLGNLGISYPFGQQENFEFNTTLLSQNQTSGGGDEALGSPPDSPKKSAGGRNPVGKAQSTPMGNSKNNQQPLSTAASIRRKKSIGLNGMGNKPALSESSQSIEQHQQQQHHNSNDIHPSMISSSSNLSSENSNEYGANLSPSSQPLGVLLQSKSADDDESG